MHICPKGLFPPALQAQDSTSGTLLLPLPGVMTGMGGLLYMFLCAQAFHFWNENVQFNYAWMLCWEVLVC